MVGNELLEENTVTEILQPFLFQLAPLTFAAHLWVLNGLGKGPTIQVLFSMKNEVDITQTSHKRAVFPSVLGFSVTIYALPSIFLLLPHQT